MQLGRVIGHATATVKHAALDGWRLLLVQPLDSDGEGSGDPLLAIEHLGSHRGDRVLLTSDGRSVRTMLENDMAPIRWAVIGIIND